MEKLYVELSRTVRAYENCCNSPGHEEWKLKHAAYLKELVHEYMPSGSGLNNGTSLNLEKSDSERLVFETSFHHMNENGLYDGWTDHTVVVTASLMFGVNIRITGRNRNDIKEYLHTLFQEALMEEVSS
jgi:hypothetical protein